MNLHLLDSRRDRAERLLNGVRVGVLLLLVTAALAYAPNLTPTLNRMNVIVLAMMLAWTVGQYVVFYRQPSLPSWLAALNPAADITAVTVILGGYAIAHSAALALRTPILLAYFVILAALPVAATRRMAAFVAVLAVVEYAGLLGFLIAGGHVAFVLSPVAAIARPLVSPLDEGAKLLLLAVAGGVATYATHWQEELAVSFERAALEREQLEARLARSQLQSLKLQLHPHFLFNTLNTITALIHTNPDAAERMISELSELLRISLNAASEQEVPLARELEVLGHYLEIQRIRFQDRLTVDFRIDEEARPALVPALVLQPLVENAIRHGIAPRASPGRIEVIAERNYEMLELTVNDNGVGEDPRRAHRDGVGLGNTRARLRSLYGGQHRFEAGTKPKTQGNGGGGFSVRMEIPYHVAPLDEARA
jgi:two-component sensor histidine kinase